MSNYQLNKFQINRRALKSQDNDNKVKVPKDVNERCWAEIHQKEDIDLALFDLREEIFDEAVNICYKKYMEKQNTYFTVHCAAEAFLKLIDWAFYRHDPGSEPTAYPPCYIPKRTISWTPDDPPPPSPKDTMARHDLQVLEEVYHVDTLKRKWPSNSSIDCPIIEEIPKEYWFPGKVKLPGLEDDAGDENEGSESQSKSKSPPSSFIPSSEVLEKVTDYSTGTGPKPSAKSSKTTIKAIEFAKDPSLQGGGDSASSVNYDYRRSVQLQPMRHASKQHGPSMQYRRSQLPSGVFMGRRSSSTRPRSHHSSNRLLPPLDLPVDPISDCRLRTLRVDTQYEVSSEVIQDTELVRLATKT